MTHRRTALDAPRPPRAARVFLGGPGGATLAFLLLVLCGVSGAAVLDPALGAWGAAVSSRADAHRAVTNESRLTGVHAERAVPIAARRAADAAPRRVLTQGGHARGLRTLTRAGCLGLPPPAASPLA